MVKCNRSFFKEDLEVPSQARIRRARSQSNEKMSSDGSKKTKTVKKSQILIPETRKTLVDATRISQTEMPPQDAMHKVLSSLQRDIKTMIDNASQPSEKSALKTLYDELFIINLIYSPGAFPAAQGMTSSGNSQSRLPDYFSREVSSATMITEEDKEENLPEDSKFASNEESTDSDFEND